LERHVYHASDHLVSDSEAFRQLAIQRYGVRPERITAVHAGIDAAPTVAVTAGLSRREARERLGWPVDPERRIVFCVRRITPRMGLENLIESVAALVGAHPDLLVMIGGKGPILEELRAQVARQGLENHVRLLGFLPDADLPIAYRAAEFTIVPSVALEGFGLVILESWAAGTPALVTPVGGMPEVVRPFAADCVLDGSGVEDVVRGIGRVLRGEQRLPEGDACQEYVRRVHEWGAVAQRLLTVYATGSL
jgi:glycosyltransferase involved in cell wall biosynthesis